MNWYIEVLKKYAVLTGRARRKEYWYFYLFSILSAIVLGIVDGLAGSSGLFGELYALVIVIPSIAVSIRRLHDIGKSGWWLLILLVPLVGVIVLLIFAVQDSQPGKNDYGPNPKVAEA